MDFKVSSWNHICKQRTFIYFKYVVFTIKKKKNLWCCWNWSSFYQKTQHCWFVGLKALYFFKKCTSIFHFWFIITAGGPNSNDNFNSQRNLWSRPDHQTPAVSEEHRSVIHRITNISWYSYFSISDIKCQHNWEIFTYLKASVSSISEQWSLP